MKCVTCSGECFRPAVCCLASVLEQEGRNTVNKDESGKNLFINVCVKKAKYNMRQTNKHASHPHDHLLSPASHINVIFTSLSRPSYDPLFFYQCSPHTNIKSQFWHKTNVIYKPLQEVIVWVWRKKLMNYCIIKNSFTGYTGSLRQFPDVTRDAVSLCVVVYDSR